MKEKILAKIAEMDAEAFSLYEYINSEMEQNHANYTDELEWYCEDYFWNGYSGESCGHVLDILDEQMYMLRELKRFVEGLEA